jgi:hypothetical protein
LWILQNKEEGYQVPESSVRIARAAFALRNVTPFPTGQLEVASLVFDSFEPALVAGIRGQSASPRQLLFKSGSVCIDLRVQPTPGTDSVVLLGQLLDSARPTQGLSDILVSLLSEGATISNKKTNDFGESLISDLDYSATNNSCSDSKTPEPWLSRFPMQPWKLVFISPRKYQ